MNMRPSFVTSPWQGSRVLQAVRLSVREHISGTAGPVFTKWPWLGPAVAVLQYVMYFRFYGMDGVTFGHNGPYGNAWKAEPLTSYH